MYGSVGLNHTYEIAPTNDGVTLNIKDSQGRVLHEYTDSYDTNLDALNAVTRLEGLLIDNPSYPVTTVHISDEPLGYNRICIEAAYR